MTQTQTDEKAPELKDLQRWAADPEAEWDDEKHEAGPDDVFRGLIKSVTEIPRGRYFSCGSAEMDGTPDVLYRLLFLCQPRAVDFSDMYKTRLFAFTSLDERFLVMVELFKYEVGLYFACERECLGGGKGAGVVAGQPGADNGWRCTSEEGVEFFRLVTQMARREQDVYPGNDFRV